ncbi:ATP-binding protein [Halomonas denitrificans]|nr:hypothetical protein [Halomonas denitrificans]
MKLRGQLLIAAALIALLPVSAFLFLGPIERLLRAGHEQAVAESAAAAVSMLRARDVLPAPPPEQRMDRPVLYRHAASGARMLDGYADDWSGPVQQVAVIEAGTVHARPAEALEEGSGPVRVAALQNGSTLDLYLRVSDTTPAYAAADGRPGDTVTIRIGNALAPGRGSRLRFAPAAPGPLVLRDRLGRLVRGHWQDRADGWSLELRLPVEPAWDAISFEVVDHDRTGRTRAVHASGPMRLVGPDPRASDALTALAMAPAWIVDSAGWVLARADSHALRARSGDASDSASGPAGTPEAPGVLDFLMAGRMDAAPAWSADRARLAGPEVARAAAGEASAGWWRTGDERAIRLRYAVPLEDPSGSLVLVLERDAGALLLLANRAVLSWFGASLVIFMAVALVLFAFVLVLSIRIRRLRNAAERAVERGGRVAELPRASAAADELGDLSRSLRGLLARQREHQRYLQTLADKLAHELRTPVSMVQSSLENLHADDDRERSTEYLRRAGQGVARLRRIVRAMSQAGQLEDSLSGETLRPIDLAALVADYTAARIDSRPDRVWACRLPDAGAAWVLGSEELLGQLLDKIVDNAVEFSPAGGRIELALRRDGASWRLTVDNEGPRIDPARRAAMFDSMVSFRNGHGRGGPDAKVAGGGTGRGRVRDDPPHLGFGLYIARCIVEFHGGRIDARATERGTAIEVWLGAVKGRGARGEGPGERDQGRGTRGEGLGERD